MPRLPELRASPAVEKLFEPGATSVDREAAVHDLVAQASQEYVPSDDELRLAVVVLAALAEAERTGETPYVLLDPELDRSMRRLLRNYPTFFEAGTMSTGRAAGALISSVDDFSCDNNCIPSASLFITILQEAAFAIIQNLSGDTIVSQGNGANLRRGRSLRAFTRRSGCRARGNRVEHRSRYDSDRCRRDPSCCSCGRRDLEPAWCGGACRDRGRSDLRCGRRRVGGGRFALLCLS